MNKVPHSRDAMVDLAIVLSVVVGYGAAEAFGVEKRWTFAAEAMALAGYAWMVRRRGRETWRDFGLRIDNFGECAGPIGAWTALGAAVIAAWAWIAGGSLWRSDMAILLPLYPLYGVVQQLVFQGVFHRRLMELGRRGWMSVGCTAVLFSLVHVGDWRLVGLTLVAGVVWSALYERYPNVWLLGLSHGFLAALAYPWLLGSQPLSRI